MAQEKSFVFSSTMESICTSLGLYVTVNNKLPICKSLGPCNTVNNSMRETRKNVEVVQPLPFPPLKLANASKEKEQIPKVMADDKPTLEPLLEWFEALIEGTIGQELETRALQGLSITKAEKGFIRTEFTVPSVAADVDGNWHGGAIATLMDTVGAVAIYSVFNHVMKSMDFSISYYSTAKIQEEVEINAKVLGNKGKLIQVMIEVRKKGNGDLIALAKQWMALKYFTVTTVSKL